MKVLRIVLISIGVLMVVAVSAYFALPGKLHVEVVRTLNASPEDLYHQVSDLTTWKSWTRWSEVDTSLRVSFGATTQGVGASMQWSGESGSGTLRITEAKPNKYIRYVLQFEGTGDAEGRIQFHPLDDSTTVTWTMDTQLDGLFRYLGISFEKLIREDFTEGLEGLERHLKQLPDSTRGNF